MVLLTLARPRGPCKGRALSPWSVDTTYTSNRAHGSHSQWHTGTMAPESYLHPQSPCTPCANALPPGDKGCQGCRTWGHFPGWSQYPSSYIWAEHSLGIRAEGREGKQKLGTASAFTTRAGQTMGKPCPEYPGA